MHAKKKSQERPVSVNPSIHTHKILLQNMVNIISMMPISKIIIINIYFNDSTQL